MRKKKENENPPLGVCFRWGYVGWPFLERHSGAVGGLDICEHSRTQDLEGSHAQSRGEGLRARPIADQLKPPCSEKRQSKSHTPRQHPEMGLCVFGDNTA